jgi:hypothetical protein
VTARLIRNSSDVRATPLRLTLASIDLARAQEETNHFTGATATAMVQTSFDRLMISRLSFGPI